MQIVMARGREIPVTTRKRCVARQAAEALFVKPVIEVPAKAAPRILEDVTMNRVAPATEKLSTAVAIVNESEHEKVFRLVREGGFVEAAKLAARLIAAGDLDGFCVYSGTKEALEADRWLEDNLSRAQKSPTTSVEIITPVRAAAILLRNKGNRKIKARNLANLLNDIASGEWKLNGESIIMAINGLLNDGQHRNLAALLTRKPIETVVTFGVVRETITTVDIGEKRDDASRLLFHDVPNYTRVAAIVALTHKITKGRIATPSEKIAFVRKHYDNLQEAARLSNNLPKGATGASFGSAALLLVSAGAPAESVMGFMGEVRGNPPKRKKSPGALLREALIGKAFAGPVERQAYTIIDLYIKWANNKSASGVDMITTMPSGFPLQAFR